MQTATNEATMTVELNTLCTAAGFNDEGDGSFSADERGFIILSVSFLRPVFCVNDGRKDHEFETAVEAVTFAQSLI